MREGVQSAGQFRNNIINTRSIFEPLGFGRPPGAPGDQVPTQLYPRMLRGFTTKESISCLSVLDKTETLTIVFLFPRHYLLNSI